jgi:hypothetical protein
VQEAGERRSRGGPFPGGPAGDARATRKHAAGGGYCWTITMDQVFVSSS